jgi:uridine kinase
MSILLGVAGGTGSGKTTIAQEICRRLGSDTAVLVEQDSYYLDVGLRSVDQRAGFNFDHPSAFDWKLLREHIGDLKSGRSVLRPVYDFHTHTRMEQSVLVEPRPVVILEGILILGDSDLRQLMDLRIFVDTGADIRLLRRLQRDIRERGRSLESVADQYLGTVRPMHEKYIQPCLKHADIIVPEGGHNRRAVSIIVGGIRALLEAGVADVP